MSEYLLAQGRAKTPQSEALDADQVENNAGGFTWALDHWAQLNRFLILGSEGGSYYVSERNLTKENVKCLERCLADDGPRLVDTIVEVSAGGRAAKNDPALFALAVAISKGDNDTKRRAAAALPLVARIGTHLYHFVAYAETMRGWGRTMRWAVSNWYAKNPEQLAYQAVKYRQRDGWSHRDLLRLAHPSNADNAGVFEWIVRGGENDTPIIEGFEKAQKASNPAETAALVREYRLPREALLTEHLTSPEVWEAMLDTGMPLTALMRNLANLTRVDVLTGERLTAVTEQLTNMDNLKKARVHPYSVLLALATYRAGRGFRGQNTWTPISAVTDALDAAFYASFGNVEPTGKRTLIGMDVSGSMGSAMGDSFLTVREAAAAMAMVTAKAEKEFQAIGFTSSGWTLPGHKGPGYYGGGVTPLDFSPRRRLDDIVNSVSRLRFGATDCALPMLYADAHGLEIDTFMVYTDNETWAGSVHPAQALQDYRRKTGIPARLVVVGMVSNGFSIADPKDAGMLDVVGFDTATPNIISEFAAGRL